jgi:hypothetical protein
MLKMQSFASEQFCSVFATPSFLHNSHLRFSQQGDAM